MADEVITLNVGGQLYTTSRATLTKFPDSMFSVIFSGRFEPTTSRVTRDKDGNYFIDRDGVLFRHVLNFMRMSVLRLPDDFKEFDTLMDEAEFYKLHGMIEALRNRSSPPVERPKPEYVKIKRYVRDALQPPKSIQWSFYGSEEILRCLPTCQRYRHGCPDAPQYDEILDRNLFYELNKLGFMLEHVTSNAMLISENYEVKEYITYWIYIRC